MHIDLLKLQMVSHILAPFGSAVGRGFLGPSQRDGRLPPQEAQCRQVPQELQGAGTRRVHRSRAEETAATKAKSKEPGGRDDGRGVKVPCLHASGGHSNADVPLQLMFRPCSMPCRDG